MAYVYSNHSSYDNHPIHPIISGWNCQPWPSRSQNWMFVYFIIILSRSQQFPTSSSQNQVELGEWATGHFMHCIIHVIILHISRKNSLNLNSPVCLDCRALCLPQPLGWHVDEGMSLQTLWWWSLHNRTSPGPVGHEHAPSLLLPEPYWNRKGTKNRQWSDC